MFLLGPEAKAAGRLLGLLKPGVGVKVMAWGGLAALALAIVVACHSASASPSHGSRQIAPALETRIDSETGGVLKTVHFYSPALR